MTDPTQEFFAGLDNRRPEVLPKTLSGTIRWDITHDNLADHWFVAIKQGHIRVSREDREADVVVRVRKAFFDDIARGRTNLVVAWLRSQLTVEGRDLAVLRRFERVFP